MDAAAGALGQHEQLGVEEPALVLDVGQQPASHVGPQGLEAALSIGEPVPERQVEERVVAAGEHLPLDLASHMRGVGEPGADRDFAVSREDRRDQREEALEVRREVDVHVGDDVGLTREPGGPECEAAALALEEERLHVGVVLREVRGDRRGAVAARVVGDHHADREREVGAEVLEQELEARTERALLVVHRNDEVDALQGGIHAFEVAAPL